MRTQDKNITRIICLITVLSALFALLAEAHPVHVSSLLRPPADKHVHGSENMGTPLSPAFFWKLYTQRDRINIGVLESQKAQLTEEFWKQFTALIAVEQKNLSSGDKETAGLVQGELVPATQTLGQTLAGQRNIFENILTPEQRHILHKQRELRKMFERFRVHAIVLTSALKPETSAFTTLVQLFPDSNESGDGSAQSYAHSHCAQNSLGYPLSQDLHHTQILQL